MRRPASLSLVLFFAATSFAIFSVLLAMPRASYGEDATPLESESVSLLGRHAITLHAGVGSQGKTQAYVAGTTVGSDVNEGILALISYAYGVTPEMTIGVTTGVRDASTSATVSPGTVSANSAAIVPLLFGIDYYPAAFAFSPRVRPYASVMVGPYFGSAQVERVQAGSVFSGSVSESVFGVRTVIGVDYFIGTRFRVGAAGGYHFIGDYTEPIGDDKNYSGPEGSIGFGVLLGKGR